MTIYIMMTVMIAVFVVIGMAVLRLQKLLQLQSSRIQTLQNQLTALTSGASGTDERILQFEQTLGKIKEQQKSFELTGSSASAKAYDNAIRLARKGAGEAQLINHFDLSTEEAHLISRLHGAQLHESDNVH